MRAPLFTGIGFLLMALLPLGAPGPVTLGRSLLAAALSLVASALIVHSWPRSHTVRIDLDTETIETDGRVHPLARAAHFTLSGGATRDGAFRLRYRVELVLDDGVRIVVLERSDPARVLEELRRALSHWKLPLESGWGLPDGAEPWRVGRRYGDPAAAKAFRVQTRPFEGELGAGICVSGGFAVIGGAMAIMHSARIERGAQTLSLSYVLSGTTAVLILALAVFLLSDRAEARVDGALLLLSRRACGIALVSRRIPLESVLGLYAVGPAPDNPLHLLIDTRDGIISHPFAGAKAQTVARVFTPQQD